MIIWIDGDACPKVIKDILFRAAIRTQTHLIIVSNHILTIPRSSFIKKIQVPVNIDAVDNYITLRVSPNDLVITADIPFANLVISKGALVLNPRGDVYSKDNIKEYLRIRDFNESLRSAHLLMGGALKISPKEIRAFASHLDKFLSK